MSCLEIAITDFCNLDCTYCSQGTPIQKGKLTMPVELINQVSKIVRPYEFEEIKISGGEPTLHPQFRTICENLHEWFPATRYTLATNGAMLARYLDCISVFSQVQLSEYPGQNEDVFEGLIQRDIPNLYAVTKPDDTMMINVHEQPNLGKVGIAERCPLRQVKKVVQQYIYPCCVVFGLSIWRGMDRTGVACPLVANWRECLEEVDLEPYCQVCFVNADAPLPWEERP